MNDEVILNVYRKIKRPGLKVKFELEDYDCTSLHKNSEFEFANMSEIRKLFFSLKICSFLVQQVKINTAIRLSSLIILLF